MNFQEYIPLAVRTAKPLASTIENVGHAVLGLLTEVDELGTAVDNNDDVNIAEELADKAWYLALLANSLEVDFDFFTNALKQEVIHIIENERFSIELPYSFVRIASQKLDIIKKSVIYNKEFSKKEISEAVFSIYFALLYLFDEYQCDESEALLANVRKLSTRYPDLYTDESALTRNLDEERKQLEGDAD